MNKPATHPHYLPAIDRALEYRAGLLPARSPAPGSPATRQWLGADFTCTVEVRSTAVTPASRPSQPTQLAAVQLPTLA